VSGVERFMAVTPWVADGDAFHNNVSAECVLASAHDAALAALSRRVAQLEGALAAMVKRYVGLVECGDCGNWDAEAEPEVIAARAALKGQG
jgi:hypothetical protein